MGVTVAHATTRSVTIVNSAPGFFAIVLSSCLFTMLVDHVLRPPHRVPLPRRGRGSGLRVAPCSRIIRARRASWVTVAVAAPSHEHALVCRFVEAHDERTALPDRRRGEGAGGSEEDLEHLGPRRLAALEVTVDDLRGRG